MFPKLYAVRQSSICCQMLSEKNSLISIRLPGNIFISYNFINFVSLRKLLISCVEKELIREHIETILQKGLNSLLHKNRQDELKLLCCLLIRVEGGPESLCLHFNKYIKVRNVFMMRKIHIMHYCICMYMPV